MPVRLHMCYTVFVLCSRSANLHYEYNHSTSPWFFELHLIKLHDASVISHAVGTMLFLLFLRLVPRQPVCQVPTRLLLPLWSMLLEMSIAGVIL